MIFLDNNKGLAKNQARIAETVNFFNTLFGKLSESHFGYLIKFKDYTKI